MKKLLILGIIFSLVLQCGCSIQDHSSVEVTAPMSESKHTTIELYMQEQVTAGPNEPSKGIYLGAYVSGNSELPQKMKTYEELFKAKQTFQVFQFTSKSKVTEQDLLRCIADQKTPYIKLLMTDGDDMTLVYQMIGALRSKYKMPIYIELFPVTQSITDAVSYKTHYQDAYEVIKKYLPDAVVVWSIDFNKAHESQVYYPGDHLVDWVGLNVYLPRFKEDTLYEPILPGPIDLWYKTFQERKPMIISGLAISHFSRFDHTYTVDNAKSKLEIFYKNLPVAYPRIKGIIYVDVDMAQISQAGMEDYRISIQPQLIGYLSGVWKDDQFLHKLEKPTNDIALTYLKYTVPALEYENRIYIQVEYAQSLSKFNYLDKKFLIEDEKGQQYYDSEQLLQGIQAYYTK